MSNEDIWTKNCVLNAVGKCKKFKLFYLIQCVRDKEGEEVQIWTRLLLCIFSSLDSLYRDC